MNDCIAVFQSVNTARAPPIESSPLYCKHTTDVYRITEGKGLGKERLKRPAWNDDDKISQSGSLFHRKMGRSGMDIVVTFYDPFSYISNIHQEYSIHLRGGKKWSGYLICGPGTW